MLAHQTTDSVELPLSSDLNPRATTATTQLNALINHLQVSTETNAAALIRQCRANAFYDAIKNKFPHETLIPEELLYLLLTTDDVTLFTDEQLDFLLNYKTTSTKAFTLFAPHIQLLKHALHLHKSNRDKLNSVDIYFHKKEFEKKLTQRILDEITTPLHSLNLSGINLSGLKFTLTQFKHIFFENSSFSECMLVGVTFICCSLIACDFSHLSPEDRIHTGNQFKQCTLENVNFEKSPMTLIVNESQFLKCRFTSTALNVYFQGSTFQACSFKEAYLNRNPFIYDQVMLLDNTCELDTCDFSETQFVYPINPFIKNTGSLFFSPRHLSNELQLKMRLNELQASLSETFKQSDMNITHFRVMLANALVQQLKTSPLTDAIKRSTLQCAMAHLLFKPQHAVSSGLNFITTGFGYFPSGQLISTTAEKILRAYLHEITPLVETKSWFGY